MELGRVSSSEEGEQISVWLGVLSGVGPVTGHKASTCGQLDVRLTSMEVEEYSN